MTRLPMVTRTITTTKVNVLCLDIEHAEPCNKVITIPRTYKDEEAILKKVKPLLETETLKVVHVVDTETEETLYGMTEQEKQKSQSQNQKQKKTNKRGINYDYN